jgi:hypothetical protein
MIGAQPIRGISVRRSSPVEDCSIFENCYSTTGFAASLERKPPGSKAASSVLIFLLRKIQAWIPFFPIIADSSHFLSTIR